MKNEEKVLSREQMCLLRGLGVDTFDASMCWIRYDADGEVIDYLSDNNEMCYEMACAEPCPTYTIGDLIEKLPKSIDIGYGEYDLEILIKGEYVGVQYTNDDDYTPFSCSNLSLIESLYSILCWLAVNHKELLEVKK